MLAPKYIPTDLQAITFDRDFAKHQRKLGEIQKDDRKKRVVDKEGPARAKLYETREKNLKFHNSEKLLAIEKDNEILLGRLVEISRKRNGASALSKSTNLPKTLNGPSRQREKDRIALENEAFAKRLLSQQPRFNRKKLELDYGKHQGLVKQIQRLDNPSTRKIKLPPLTGKEKKSPTEEEKEDLAEAEEKQEQAEKEKKAKEEKEAQEKAEREKKEKADKEEAERKAKEEKEKKEHEDKEEAERKAKEEKEKKEHEDKEEAEKKAKEEKEAEEKAEKEKKEKEEKEAQEKAEREQKEKEEAEKKAEEEKAKVEEKEKTPAETETEKKKEE